MALALLGLSTACTPVPGRVAMSGDSVLLTGALNGGGWRGADYQGKVGLGWEAQHAQARLTQDVNDPARSPAVLVVAFGQNYGDSFSQNDRNALFQFVFTPDDLACVVLVLPHPGRTWEPSHAANIRAVRQTLLTLADARNNAGSKTVVVDWSALVAQHPEYLADDGVHLDPADSDGNGQWDSAEAYMDLAFAGVAECGVL